MKAVAINVQPSGHTSHAAGVSGSQAWDLITIVILRVEDGGDLFLTLQGKYEPSFLGIPLPMLVAQQCQQPAQPGQLAPDAQSDLQHAQELARSGPLFKLLSKYVQQQGSSQQDENDASTEVAQLVPWQMRQLAAWLTLTPGHLSTPGLFTSSAWELLGRPTLPIPQSGPKGTPSAGAGAPRSGAGVVSGPGTGTGAGASLKGVDEQIWCDRTRVRALVGALGPLRAQLDKGPQLDTVDSKTDKAQPSSAHEAACMLLAVFAELPQPLVPLTVASACDTSVSTCFSDILRSYSVLQCDVRIL